MEDSTLCAIHAKRQTILKADMVLAKRLRGDDNHDHIDRVEKTGDEIFYQLPYRNEKEAMDQLRAQLKNMDDHWEAVGKQVSNHDFGETVTEYKWD